MTRVLFVYNQVSEKERKGLFGECTLEKDVEIIRSALQESNNDILSLNLESPEQLEKYVLANQPVDLAFVIAEGFKAEPHTLYNGHGAALIRRYLAKFNIPSTLSSVESMEICRNKDLTYARLIDWDIPIPKFLVFETHFLKNINFLENQVTDLGYPVIIKPAGGGNSIGITSKSVVSNFQHLKIQVKNLYKQLGHTNLIIEKFLDGPEYTIGLLGNRLKYILPIIEFPRKLGVRDTATKKNEHKIRDQFNIIANSDSRFSEISEIGVKTFEAVRANDLLRIDLKEDEYGKIYVIDVNGTPSLTANGSLNFMASKLGIEHKRLIQMVLYESMKRYGFKPTPFFDELIKEYKTRLDQYESSEVA
ncbi:MAG: hypothetical protein ACOYJ1_01340 [Peptococcales bacterium]|jgi:D-alanine-D-alanine ligase